MKRSIKIIISLLLVVLALPFLIGAFMPKERVVSEMAVIDKAYFFILADITNHWEEPSWHHDLDTMIQSKLVDGQDSWIEYYSNGDSLLLITQKIAETDYIRFIATPEGRSLTRVITVADYKGKTAIRISEEAYEGNVLKRLKIYFKDPVRERLASYISDLKKKNEAKESDNESPF